MIDKINVFKKLRFDDSKIVLVVNAPVEYLDILAGIDYDVEILETRGGGYDFVQVFATSQDELERLVVEVGKAGKYDCLYWSCYPKGTGKIKSDIKRETVWEWANLA